MLEGITEYIVDYLETASGDRPFARWIDALPDEASSKVDARLDRVKRGLFGDHENLGEGVFELKIH